MEAKKLKDKYQRFGRYLILDHLVDGGMARISRARYLGDQADKIVAIKMIKSQYSENPSFRKMFLDEIKVTFGLIHKNIAQTYDYGDLGGQLFTAMEYIDGKNLKMFMERLIQKGSKFKIDLALYITSEAAQALSYAHHFTDPLTGKDPKIIHRDISPHNIMVSYDGGVKVIDFGIAKASTNSEETQAGTIKGKLSYLAPEYLEGVALDHRYDQFALGITLWEMVCGRKLFQASNELAILKKIQACQIPIPSTIDPTIPKELDNIILKTLARNRNDRFENMDQLNRALVKLLYSKYPDFNSADLSTFSKKLFEQEIKQDKEHFQTFGRIDVTPYLEELKKESATASGFTEDKIETPSSSGDDSETTVGRRTKDRFQYMEADFNKDDRSSPETQIDRYKKDKSISLKSINNTVKVDIVDINKKNNLLQRKKFMMSVGVLFIVLIGGALSLTLYSRKGISLTPSSASSLNLTSNSGAVDISQNKVKITEKNVLLRNSNPYQTYYVNNRKVELVNQQIIIPLNTNVELRVEQNNKRPIFLSFTLTEDAPALIDLPNAKDGLFGTIDAISQIFVQKHLIIDIDGHSVTIYLPTSKQQLPVGKYKGQLVNERTETFQDIEFVVQENKVTDLDLIFE